jgi:hypothetical protein
MWFCLQGCYNSLNEKIKSHVGVIIGVAVGNVSGKTVFFFTWSMCLSPTNALKRSWRSLILTGWGFTR